MVLADTLAAHQLGGFKVGVGFALRVCRDCMATKDMIQDKVTFCIFFFTCLVLEPYHWVCLFFWFFYFMKLGKTNMIAFSRS